MKLRSTRTSPVGKRLREAEAALQDIDDILGITGPDMLTEKEALLRIAAVVLNYVQEGR
jgi:hypothetical protein